MSRARVLPVILAHIHSIPCFQHSGLWCGAHAAIGAGLVVGVTKLYPNPKLCALNLARGRCTSCISCTSQHATERAAYDLAPPLPVTANKKRGVTCEDTRKQKACKSYTHYRQLRASVHRVSGLLLLGLLKGPHVLWSNSCYILEWNSVVRNSSQDAR